VTGVAMPYFSGAAGRSCYPVIQTAFKPMKTGMCRAGAFSTFVSMQHCVC
jgi:hypothetical protein